MNGHTPQGAVDVALDNLAEKIAAGGGVTIAELFDCVSLAAHDLAASIRNDDQERGPHAATAFLNSLEMLPAVLREDIALAVRERPGLAENPRLARLAL